MGSRVQDKVFREIYEILVKIESRLSIIEETIKKEDTKNITCKPNIRSKFSTLSLRFKYLFIVIK